MSAELHRCVECGSRDRGQRDWGLDHAQTCGGFVPRPTERKYAMTRIKAGDYLLPSNDAQTIWRIARYTEGPSSGLDWPRDRDVWGYWRWTGSSEAVDPESWDRWEWTGGMLDTRSEAVAEALRS